MEVRRLGLVLEIGAGAVHTVSAGRVLIPGLLLNTACLGDTDLLQRDDGQAVAVADLDHVVVAVQEEALVDLQPILNHSLSTVGDAAGAQLCLYLVQRVGLEAQVVALGIYLLAARHRCALDKVQAHAVAPQPGALKYVVECGGALDQDEAEDFSVEGYTGLDIAAHLADVVDAAQHEAAAVALIGQLGERRRASRH